MMNLDLIFNKALSTHRFNKEIQTERDKIFEQKKREKEEAAINMRNSKTILIDYEKGCYSKELLKLIKQYNFKIESYEKFTINKKESLFNVLETYYCSYNNWNFDIQNFSDYDIKEGIFSISNVRHKITEEKVAFYCDIGCRNTNKERLDTFLEFIDYNSLDEFVKYKYNKYIVLPDLLKENGYNAEVLDCDFKSNSFSISLKLDNNIFINVCGLYFNNLRFIITNYDRWNISSNNDNFYNLETKAYYFDYKSENDIKELCKCIECFKEDIAGKVGYFENDKYYSNRDVFELLDEIRNKEKISKDYKCEITIDHNDYWNSCGYKEDEVKSINKYIGLELYVQFQLSFNDEAQWSIDGYTNKSIITFEYDKTKNDSCCKLKIDNYIYKSGELTILEHNSDNSKSNYILNKDKLVDSIETYGSFLELYEFLKSYIYKMCELNEIILE